MAKIISLENNYFDNITKIEKSILLRSSFKILDWEQAVNLCIEYDIYNAYVGLAEDWSATCAQMINNGEPCPYGINIPYGYCLASQWATPCLYDEDIDIAYECYYKQNKIDWDTHAKGWWPDETITRYIYERG